VTSAPLEERDDDALLALSAAGSAAAFRVLVARHLPAVTRYCAKFLGDAAAGEDVAQECLVELWERRARYRPEGRFVAYLLTLARSRCLNHARGDRRRAARVRAVEGEAGDPAAAARPDQLDALLEGERWRRVREGLSALPAHQREALLLRFDQGLRYPEIARVLGKAEEAVRSRVHKGLLQLRARVGGGE
jgi:RNA polymerase sigma-70 factor (ECF subfamily)